MERILNKLKTEPLSKVNLRFVLWRFLMLWLSLTLIVGAGVWLFYLAESEKAYRLERIQSSALVRNANLIAKARVERAIQDVSFLALVAQQMDLPQQHSDANMRRLAEVFFTLMSSRPDTYDQMRLLDLHGKELVRVNRMPDGVPNIIASHLLQDKSDRYYIRETLALNQGEIYISPMDLNVEHGSVETPYKPMIRFGTPLQDASGKTEGMILINYLGLGLLDRLKQNAQLHEKALWLVNSQGYWLLGPSSDKEWGFMFQEKARVSFANEYPDLWRAIQAEPTSGQLAIRGGLLSYSAFDPYQELIPGQLSTTKDKSIWFIVEFLPSEHFQASVGQLKTRLLLTWSATSFLIGLVSFYSALLLLRRKLLMDDLSQSKHYAEILLASTPDAILVCDADGQILLTNDQANQLFGYSQEELLGNCIDMLVPQHLRSGHAALRAQYMHNPHRRNMGEGMKLFAERKDGVLLPVNIGLNYIGHGANRLAIAEVRDVSLEFDSAQKITRLNEDLSKQNELLTHIKERFELSTQASGVGIWDWDIVNDQLFWDEQMFLLYDVKPERFRNRYEDWLSMVVSEDRERFHRTVTDALKNRTKFDTEYRIRRSDGHVRFLIGIGRVFHDEQCQPVRMLGSNVDITPRKELELRLIDESEKLELRVAERTAELEEARHHAEQLTQAKSQFLANMSHEIRTPMNAILGLAYILEKSSLAPDVATMVHKICNAGRSLQAMINDVLDLSKLEAGRLNIEQSPFRLDDVLDNLATIVAANLGNKPVEVVIQPPSYACNDLIGDSLRLGQVLINLASNAIKFTAHGHVAVKISVVNEGCSKDTIHLKFAVIDTGIGISADKQKEIFEPFSQADTSTTRRFGGTGLGLSICRQLITLMGGELWLKSELGKGSEFAFTLPFKKASSTAYSQPEMNGLNVLIADDSEVAREAIIHTVQRLGWHAKAFSSGDELIDYLSRGPVHADPDDNIMLLDWMMPGLDGLDTARKIHEQLGEDRKPIVVMMIGGHPLDRFVSHPDAQLADAVISKPITASTLYDAIAKVRRDYHVLNGHPNEVRQRLRGMRILVVDDNDINRDVAQRIFADEGALVNVASDGLQAFEIIQSASYQYDIVLMDLQMPIMDGFQATRAIKALPGLNDFPVIALTAGTFDDDQELARASGMDGFIPKPFNVDLAINSILQAVGRLSRFDSNEGSTVRPSDIEVAMPVLPDLPGLDLRLGMHIWKDIAVYKQYLRKFVRDYEGFVGLLADDHAEVSAIAVTAHKLKGAAGNLGLSAVGHFAGNCEKEIKGNGQLSDAKAKLRGALITALQSIQEFLSNDTLDEAPTKAIDLDSLAPLLREALTALDTDSPDAIEAVLEELGEYLSGNQLQPLRLAVENFDFRGGEKAVRCLAETLNLSLDC